MRLDTCSSVSCRLKQLKRPSLACFQVETALKRTSFPLVVSPGGEVTPIHASPETTLGEFRSLVLRTLRPDDDELTRKVSVVELILGETPLPEDLDSLTLAESGVSPDAVVPAVFSKRSVECCREEESSYDLRVPERAVMLNIPDGTTEIEDCAFTGCCSIASATIPNSVTRIGTGAFAYCSSLLNLTIPESVETIEVGAFAACSSLTSLTLPGSVSDIGPDAFQNCTSLASLTISGRKTHPVLSRLCACSSLADLKSAESPALWEVFLQGC